MHTSRRRRKKEEQRRRRVLTYQALLQWWRSLGQGWSISGYAGRWRWTSCLRRWFPPGWRPGLPGLCRLWALTLEWRCCPACGRTQPRLASARPLDLQSQRSPYTAEGQIQKHLMLDPRSYTRHWKTMAWGPCGSFSFLVHSRVILRKDKYFHFQLTLKHISTYPTFPPHPFLSSITGN